jgi:pyroglutamyl-peptidase
MSGGIRILITGFGPFPGAPSNPTMRIAKQLGQLRRPRHADIRLATRLLPTTWAMLDAVPGMIREIKPDAVLMFGLAGRRRKITPEMRGMNRAGVLRMDAAGKRPDGLLLAPGGPVARSGGISAIRMVAALRRAGLAAAVSRDAGDYLCNALVYRMAGLEIPCIFVHVPRPVRPTRPTGQLKRPRPTMAQLHRAAEIALDQVLLRIR